MTKRLVIDASLAAAYLLREPAGEKFDPMIRAVAKKRLELYVPSLFTYEMLNIIAMAERRKRISPVTRDGLMGELSAIPLIEGKIREDAQRNIILLAREFDLTAYDAAYLELAIRLDSKLATLDADLLKLKRIFNWIE